MTNLKSLELPSAYYDAIVNVDYSGLDKKDISFLNETLLNNGVSFNAVKRVSEPYIKLISGAYCELMTFYWSI